MISWPLTIFYATYKEIPKLTTTEYEYHLLDYLRELYWMRCAEILRIWIKLLIVTRNYIITDDSGCSIRQKMVSKIKQTNEDM
jgi:hypothetical protein